MFKACVTGGSLVERSEAIRFQIFFVGLRHRHTLARILGRNPEESLREQLGILTLEDQDRLLFLLEHRLLPMPRKLSNPVSRKVLDGLARHLASSLPTVKVADCIPTVKG